MLIRSGERITILIAAVAHAHFYLISEIKDESCFPGAHLDKCA